MKKKKKRSSVNRLITFVVFDNKGTFHRKRKFLIFFNINSDETLKYIFTVVRTMFPISDTSVFYDHNGYATYFYRFLEISSKNKILKGLFYEESSKSNDMCTNFYTIIIVTYMNQVYF